jgi:hypothetical protein
MKSGRGRGRGLTSPIRDAVGLFVDEWEGVVPGKGTSLCRYDELGAKIVGRGYPLRGMVISAGSRRER